MEEFKDIIGYEGLYQISSHGNVKSVLRNKILAKRITGCGYITVALTKNGNRKEYKEHRLIAEAFIEKKQNKNIVNHINGITTDNRIENLEWVDCRENLHHHHLSKRKRVGICYHKKAWIARIYFNGKSLNVGSFKCETAAHLAYLQKSKSLNIQNSYN